MWEDKAFWYLIIFIFCFIVIKIFFKKPKKIFVIFTIIYITLGGFLASAYIYTHTPVSDIVPPIVYVRFLDLNENPIKNASCFADIWTEKGYTENKPLKVIWTFRELECYGREKCPKEDYWGYYKLDVTNYSYKKFFWIFQKQEGLIKGDFQINIVCRKNNFFAHYEFNETNSPCSPLPLFGNYVTPSFYCSEDKKVIEKHAYYLDNETFDEYDKKAIDFINENYKEKVILSNNKLAIVIYSEGINKPVGIIPDKESYGDPYAFNEFISTYCYKKINLINKYNIDLILSRFELYECDFMKLIYSNKDYIYEVVR